MHMQKAGLVKVPLCISLLDSLHVLNAQSD
jgi:hypothetical protein